MVNLHAFSVLAACASTYAQLEPKLYTTLPLGNVMPLGWLKDQLQVQMDGLGGNLQNFWDYVADTDWLGGDSAYSSLEEAGSYWFNAMVPAAVLNENEELINSTYYFLNYVLDHQEDTGWLGPEANNNKTRYLWGRYPFFFGAIMMVERDPSLTDRVVSAMQKFVPLANQMMRNNSEGVDIWTATRWEDFVITLQWLYDFHPEGNEDLLLDTMQYLKWTGVPWEVVFPEKNFPKIAVDTLTNPTGYVLSWHGVNMAEGLKGLPAQYRFLKNESDIELASSGWDLLFEYHGRPSGIFAADEYLAGREASRGTELCAVVELMYSASYLYQIIGDTKFLDRAERAAYNGLPAELTGDMWHRQYDQQQNQIAAKNMTIDPFYVNSGYSNVFGLEPYYPCCTVNHPQGWPKFIAQSFLKSEDEKSLVQAYFGPVTVSTILNGNNIVAVTVETLYPFSDAVKNTISATEDFTYLIRVPEWVVNGTISINAGQVQPLEATNGVASVPISSGQTTMDLVLSAEIVLEDRLHDAIAVHRGPLHYAMDITYNTTVIKVDPLESRATDLQFLPTNDWAFAIDPVTLEFHTKDVDILPSPIFDSNLPPVSMTVQACPIDWGVVGSLFADIPPTSPACTGDVQTITLTPFGSTKLRISEFPTFSSS